MPLPLNFANREFAGDTREPSAAFMRALSELYEAFALIEDNQLGSVAGRLNEVASKLEAAISNLEKLHSVTDRWTQKDEGVFEAALAELSTTLGYTPTGDRAVIDALVSELEQLKALVRRHAAAGPGLMPPAPIPSDDEGQFHLTSRILRSALRVQEIGMAATRLSLVSKGDG